MALFAFHELEERAIEEGHGLQEDQCHEGQDEDLEQEIGVEPVRAEPGTFDVPFHDPRLAQHQVKLVRRRNLGGDQVPPEEVPCAHCTGD